MFESHAYTVSKETGLLDYDQIRSQAKEVKPLILLAGYSAYPRKVNFRIFREIADEVGAVLMVDMAHFAGLVAGKVFTDDFDPVAHAHVTTTTTHKTLRGPRGGMILCNDDKLARKIDSAVFPGLQGGPLMHVIAAKAVAFKEALDPSFKIYSEAVVSNALALGQVLQERGVELVTGGTDTHLLLVDLRMKGLKGNIVEKSLERAGITCNKNAVPFDPESPSVTSGVRLGTPAGTTRGFGNDEFRLIGELIGDVLDGLCNSEEQQGENTNVEKVVKARIMTLCEQFPLYSENNKM